VTKASTIRLASYNLRKCRGTDGRRLPERVLDVIGGLGADVIALQEADMRLGPRPAALPAAMIEARTDYTAVPLGGADVSLGWHGNAILVRKGTTVSAPRRLDLPGLEPRGAVAVEVAGLRVVGVHLGLLRRSRRAQLAHLRATLAALPPMPTAILGDWNEWSPATGLEALDGAFTIHAPGRSFHARRPVAALDRVAHCAGLALRDAGVCETRLARRASDHLPIWADLKRVGAPAAAEAPVLNAALSPAA